MNLFKKMGAMLLVFTMVFGLTVTAFAVDEQVTIGTTGHTYKAYQLFSGTQVADEKKGAIADLNWGSGINAEAFIAALKADERFGKGTANLFNAVTYDSGNTAKSARDVATILRGMNDQNLRDFGMVATAHAKGTGQDIAADATTVTLPEGYYMFVDTTNLANANDAKNVTLLQVTKNGKIDIAKKYSVPTVTKDVKQNDNGEWQKYADYNIGDNVPFKLTGTLPNTYADYKTYYYAFNDTLGTGLSVNKDTVTVKVVKADDTSFDVPAAAYTVETPTTGPNLVIKIADLKTINVNNQTVEATDKIVVEYTAKLNSADKISVEGVQNKVFLEFSNNPNNGGEGDKGKTPEEKVTVFSFYLQVNKKDQDGQNLTGAKFKLYRETQAGGKEYAKLNGKIVNGWATDAASGSVLDIPTDKQYEHHIGGLDAGTYYVEEVEAPGGYNSLEKPVKVVITATYDTNNPKVLTGVTITADGVAGTVITVGNEQYVTFDVTNQKGLTLPETGGIGTTIFYVLGAALVIGAGVLLVVKKRMSTTEK